MVNITNIRFMDKLLGKLLSFILFSKKKQLDKVNSILFIQLWGIGETILTLPAIRSISKKFPEAKITILATERNKEVYNSTDINLNVATLDLNPLNVLSFIIKSWKKYDLVIDLEEYLYTSSIISYCTGKHRIGYSNRKHFYNQYIKYNDKQHVTKTFLDLSKLLDGKDEGIGKLTYSEEQSQKVDMIIGKCDKKIIGIVPGAAESAKSRMWPKENFTKLVNSLEDYCIVFIGSKQEKQLVADIIEKLNNDVINITGELSLRELFCLIDKLDLLITNDTGPLHIASAQNTKTIGLFGPNTPVRFGPLTKGSVTIYKPDCKFSPCINVHQGQVPDCLSLMKHINLYQHCMKNIKVEDVLKVVKNSLS